MNDVNPELVIFDSQLVAEREYWIDRITKANAATTITDVLSLTKGVSDKKGTVNLRLTGETYRKLNELARSSPFLIYVFLMTTLKICLHKYTGDRRIVIGSPSLRGDASTVQTANLLAIIDEIDEQIPFRELLLKVRQTLLDAYARQQYPFERLVEDLGLETDGGRSRLFQVALSMTNIHDLLPRLPSDVISIAFQLAPDHISGQIGYDQGLFSPWTIARLSRHYVDILEAALEGPDALTGELTSASKPERHQLLVEWNDVADDYPGHTCVHQLIEAIAAESPEAVAVVFNDETLTYGVLNNRANQLARYLRRMGVGPEAHVGICIERSLEMVIGMLGILKAGGAYLPFDSSYPIARLAFMLEDAQVPVLVSQERLLEQMPAYGGEDVCLDRDWEAIACESDENVCSGVTDANTAYIIYTSGSTGQPKGVTVVHRGLTNLVTWHERAFAVTPVDRATQVASLGFDAAGWEVWPYLSTGACLDLPRENLRISPISLMEWLAEREVTIAFLPTPWAEAIIDQPAPKGLALRILLTGGDRLHKGPKSKLPYQFINNYGPTESTVVATSGVVEEGEHGAPSIGRAIANTSIYLLDDLLRPVPAALPAELFIGGHGLARAYLSRPDLTADRFLPDPFASLPGQRLYRTGDLVRARLDGAIDYLARRDEQVKLRGFRIELGEVETALKRLPSVREAAAVVRQDRHGHKQLVAYVVLRAGAMAPSAIQWRKQLGQWLPEYMVPTHYVELSGLPLTNNGKVDRQSLPEPERGRCADGYLAAETARERALAEVWAEVLGLERVGVEDNFFDLGGDSIRSIQVAARARERGVKVSIEALFEHPTIRELAAAHGEETEDPSEWVEQQRVEAYGLLSVEDRGRLLKVIPEGIEDAYPLTRLQTGMVFHNEYSPEASVYHNIISLHLSGPLDISVMRAAIDDLIKRHAVLRTSFDLTSYSQPLQLVHRSFESPLYVTDLQHLFSAEQEAALARFLDEEKKLPFKWDRAPLVRFHIFQRSSETFQLIMSFPHAILDGWSDAMLLTELIRHYLYLLGHAPEDIGPPPQMAFRDYVALERRALESEESRQFWRELLDGHEPMRLSRWPANAGMTGAAPGPEKLTPLAPELTESLNRLASNLGVPLKTVMLAAHLRMLSWLYCRQDVITGLVLNGRPPEADAERIVGLFLNATPFRFRLPEGTWEDLVRATYEAERNVLPHRRYPLAEIQRMLGGGPLFEVAFDFLHFHVFTGLSDYQEKIRLIGGQTVAVTNFAIAVNFRTDPFKSETGLSLMYDDRELSREQVIAIKSYYERTLAAMATDSTARYESISPLSAAERHQLLIDWNDTTLIGEAPLPIHRLVEAQSAVSPAAIALSCEGQQLSYQELNRRANQLGHHLRSLGVGPETRVGVCLDPTVEQVVAALGVLKAGGAYVPLDPNYPIERLRFVLEDAATPALVTNLRVMDELPAMSAHMICPESDWATISQAPEHNPPPLISSDNLAYVVYTSGSTGRPKGVEITHRSLLNLCLWHQEQFAVSGADRATQLANPAFDAAVWEVWPYLLRGASLHLAPEADRGGPERLREWLREEQITISFAPTPVAERLLELELDEGAALRVLLTGGDRLGRGAPKGLGFRVVNNYGPTEATVVATSGEVEEGREGEAPAIGRGIGNVEIYVVDGGGRAVGIGITGELWIGGEGVGRGYLNDPRQTAERFAPDPFSQRPGARVYRSGDLALYRFNGEIEYVGRIDRQVKVRGYRIEPGEVEAELRQHPGVRQCVVLLHADPHGEQRLVGYIAPSPLAPPEPHELRHYLLDRLPEYMAPSIFVMIEELPLTSNGKVDRSALPPPERSLSEIERGYVAPRTPSEELLADIWSQVLGVERVGGRDDFFDLGGHSLLAIQVVSRVRETFNVALPLPTLFKTPTVEAVGALLDAQYRNGLETTVPPIVPVPREEALPLSFAQQRLWFLDHIEAGSPFYNFTTAVRIAGRLSLPALEQSLSDIVRRHEVLRTTYPAIDGRPRQTITRPRPITVSLIDWGAFKPARQEAAIARLAAEQARRPFDLSNERLLRITLARLDAETHVLLFTMHHIVTDGWSMGILFHEMAMLFEAFSQGRPSSLRELETQYADFAVWQREWMRGAVLEEQLAYWRRQLEGELPVLELPSDRPRPAAQSYCGAKQTIVLPADLTATLKTFSRREGATIFMTMLAAFKALLFRYTGQQDIIIGTDIANRNKAETENMLGFFVNQLVIRTRLGDDASFRQLLKQVRETTLGAYAHQDLPFDVLVRELQPERNLSRAPLFQAKFIFQHALFESNEQTGPRITPIDFESGVTPFDFVISVAERSTSLVVTSLYSTDLFDAETIARLLKHYQTLLEKITADPDQRLTNLRLLAEDESGGASLADFPDAELSQKDFENLILAVGKIQSLN